MKLLYLISRRPLDVARVRREVGKLAQVTDALGVRLGLEWESGETTAKILAMIARPKPPLGQIRKGVRALAYIADTRAKELYLQHAPVARNMVPSADYSGVIRPAVSHGGAGSKGCQDCKLIERAWKLLGTDKCERGG